MDDCKKPTESIVDQLALLEQDSLTCPDIEDLLDPYLDDELHPELEKKFLSHVSDCELCDELVHDCKHLLSLARSLNDNPIPEEVQSRLRDALKREVGFSLADADNTSTRGKLSVVKSGS